MSDPSDNSVTTDDDAAALELIRAALRAPRVLTRQESLDFIAKRIYMGPPRRLPPPRRGRPPKKTQYDLAAERRMRLYNIWKRRPESGTQGLLKIGLRTGELICKFVLELRDTVPHQRYLAMAIIRRMDELGHKRLDEKTVRTHLARLRRLGLI